VCAAASGPGRPGRSLDKASTTSHGPAAPRRLLPPPRQALWLPLVCLAAALSGAFVRAAAAAEAAEAPTPDEREEANVSGGLDFLECEGPGFDPAWGEFKRRLSGRPIVRGAKIGDELANLAANLLDGVESRDLGTAVAAFGARLRGHKDVEETLLDGFCLFGAVAAYAAVAVHLDTGLGPDQASGLEPTAKSSIARALLLLAKKQINDFMESTGWPIRSLDLVAMLEGEDAAAVRALDESFRLPCHLSLGCRGTLLRAEEAVSPPEHPLAASWPREVAAVGMHTTSTMEAVSALRDAVAEAWGRGGAGVSPFNVRFAGHPCPSHSGSEHHCQMRCDLLGACGPDADASDPLADFIAGAVDVARFEERESYSLAEARAALRWVPGRLASIAKADLVLCTFPTVLCVLLHELFPMLPLLFVAIANPLFAAPGCTRREDTTVRECETDEAREYLRALRSMLSDPMKPVRGVAAYSVTAALVGYQAGVALPLAGKAGRYLPASASWRLERPTEVLVARSRFLETAFGPHFRTLFAELSELYHLPIRCVLQQDEGAYLSYDELSAFRAVVILPQDLGLHKFTEHYAMAMPIWVPAKVWAYRLQMLIPWGMVSYSGTWHPTVDDGDDHTPPPGDPARLRAPSEDWPQSGSPQLAHPPFYNAQTVPYPLTKVAYWYEFSEFIAYPGVQSFASMPALLSGLAGADLFQISGEMRRFRAELWRTTRAVYAAAASDLAAVAAEAQRRAEAEAEHRGSEA